MHRSHKEGVTLGFTCALNFLKCFCSVPVQVDLVPKNMRMVTMAIQLIILLLSGLLVTSVFTGQAQGPRLFCFLCFSVCAQ